MTVFAFLRWTLAPLVAACALAACGGAGGGSPATSEPQRATDARLSGVVAAAALVPGSTTAPTFKAGYYQGARVCEDGNGNGRCDTGENAATTDSSGRYTLAAVPQAGLIADIGVGAKNTANNTTVSARVVLRISQAQIDDQAASGIVISALSSELQRQVEANASSYAVEKQKLSQRMSVDAAQVLGDFNAAAGAARAALAGEAHELGQRFAYATLKLDRGDLYPDALAVPGGDPELTGLAGVTAVTAAVKDSRKAITFLQAQQAAFEIEGIPRYDHIFVIMLENKAQLSILNSPSAPHINALLAAGNQATSYFSTGNPSQPNYIALGGGDDFGIVDNAPWNCNAVGESAVQDATLPELVPKGAPSPFLKTCTIAGAAPHNIVGRPNLFAALSSKGLTWRVYSQSMNPGQDPRTASVGDAAVLAPDNLYAVGTVPGVPWNLGNPRLLLPMPDGLYHTKHHPAMVYQSARNLPEFSYSNRTLGDGQWDSVLKNSTAYAFPANYDVDQFGTDLVSGQVGHLNFLIPDQCDSMHGHPVMGAVSGTSTMASDCNYVASNVAAAAGGVPIILRGDNFVGRTVAKIKASALWKNPQLKVAIVVLFDEGNATGGFNSCCGWNPGGNPRANPLKQNADGSFAVDTSVPSYARGNRGHGQTIFGVLNNQPSAPKGVRDSDAYSHFSFVRTLQDMFQLADPGVPSSYMNRSKYTEKFIARNLANLPEYADSADTHFDAVRPMNHAFVAPPTYVQKQSADAALPPQTGPDASQANVWSIR